MMGFRWIVAVLTVLCACACVSSRSVWRTGGEAKAYKTKFPIYLTSAENFRFKRPVTNVVVVDPDGHSYEGPPLKGYPLEIPAGVEVRVVDLVWNENITVNYFDLRLKIKVEADGWMEASGIIYPDLSSEVSPASNPEGELQRFLIEMK